MNKSIPSYRGAESYMFVCYAHRDSNTVFSDLAELDRNGVRFWYDEGIQPGSSWRAEIAAAIKGATRLLFFVSKSSLASTHCLREVDYALNNDINIIPIYLDNTPLPGELELALNRVQALFRQTDPLYMQHLLGALQGHQASTPLAQKPGRRTGLVVALLLAAGLGLVSAFIWTQQDAPADGKQTTSTAIVPADAFDPYLQGLELMKRWDQGDNLATAVEQFREATRRDPGFALAFARMAEALRMRHALTGEDRWLDEASRAADTAVSLNPDLAPVQVALGRIQAAQGNTDLAFAAMQRAVAIDPNDAVANQAMASMYARLGRLEDAEASFRKAVALDPENFLVLDGYANFLFDQSRYDDAVQQWKVVVRLAPDHYVALVNLGSALSETGRTAEAITMYQRAIEIKPTYMAYVNLGTANARSGRYPDAVQALQKALSIDDSDWLAWGNLAFAYTWMNGMDRQTVDTFGRAIQLAEAARQQNPRDPFVYSDLALYYAKTDQPELAMQRLGTALALSADSGEIMAAAAETHEIMGQRERAIELAQAALELGFPMRQLQRNHELVGLLTDPRMQKIE